jgi:hypothetical protein
LWITRIVCENLLFWSTCWSVFFNRDRGGTFCEEEIAEIFCNGAGNVEQGKFITAYFSIEIDREEF